jgi:hypothetical protein
MRRLIGSTRARRFRVDREIEFRFDGLSPRQASEAARTLVGALGKVDGVTKVERVRANEDALDFGATLVLVLGTPAITAVAHALVVWAKKRNHGRIEIGPRGTLLTGVDSQDMPAILKALRN